MVSLYITSPRRKNGKTFLTAGLAGTMQSLGYSTSVYKPIQTSGLEINGFTQSPDLTYVKTLDPYVETYFSYLFKDNNIPLISSEEVNDFIDIEAINNEYSNISNKSECVILDGEQGLLTPLAPSVQTIDMLKRLQIPILITIPPCVDYINETLSVISLAQANGVEVRGVIINNILSNSDNRDLVVVTRLIEEYSNVKVLGLLPNLGENPRPEDIITGILNGIDIESVFSMKIEKLEIC